MTKTNHQHQIDIISGAVATDSPLTLDQINAALRWAHADANTPGDHLAAVIEAARNYATANGYNRDEVSHV